MLTYGIPPEFRGGVHLFILNRRTPSGQSRVYRVTQMRTDGVYCRESAGTGPVNLKGSSKRVLPWQITMAQLICTSLSHTHYWYEVSTSFEVCERSRNELSGRAGTPHAVIKWRVRKAKHLRSAFLCYRDRVLLRGATMTRLAPWLWRLRSDNPSLPYSVFKCF